MSTSTSTTTSNPYEYLMYGTVDNPLLWSCVAAAVALFIALLVMLFFCCRSPPPRPPMAIHYNDLAPLPRAMVSDPNQLVSYKPYYEPLPPQQRPLSYPPPQEPYQAQSYAEPQLNNERDFHNDDTYIPHADRRSRFYDWTVPTRTAKYDLRKSQQRIYDSYLGNGKQY